MKLYINGVLNYNNCLVNLANSILKEFGVGTIAKSLVMADAYLDKHYTNVVLLLLDGMGVSIIEKHLDANGFFRSHLKGSYCSVFPPTTVAATTSILSGMYPNEHGWLGWDLYFPEIDRNVTVFKNSNQLTERIDVKPNDKEKHRCEKWEWDSLAAPETVADFNVGYRYLPYKNILDRISEAGGQAFASMPFMSPYPDTFDKVLDHIKELCHEPGKKFIYAYWNEPDSILHRTGTMSSETHETVLELEEKVRELAADLSDTLLIITADHGHMDSRSVCLLDYPEVVNCLVRMPSIEPRSLNLFVKEEYKKDFPELFKKSFGDEFLLMTKREVFDNELFGIGENRPGIMDMVGDYIAIAVSNSSIYNTHFEANLMKSGHAGLTMEEVQIPFIAVLLNN